MRKIQYFTYIHFIEFGNLNKKYISFFFSLEDEKVKVKKTAKRKKISCKENFTKNKNIY